jgi:acylglycerol lipase
VHNFSRYRRNAESRAFGKIVPEAVRQSSISKLLVWIWVSNHAGINKLCKNKEESSSRFSPIDLLSFSFLVLLHFFGLTNDGYRLTRLSFPFFLSPTNEEMGCAGSKPELDSDEIYSKAMSNAPEGVIWKEALYKFEDDGKTSADKKLLPNTRNVVSWLPADGKIVGIVFIAHGLFAHANAHHKEACAFAKQGFAVYGMDHVAHGKSSGDRGRINSWKELRDDYIAFANSMQTLHPANTPVLLYGHSMGTLITANAASGINNVKAIMFSGFALVAGPGAASIFGCRCLYPVSKLSFVAKIGACMAALDPKGPTAPLILEDITSDKNLLEQMRRDPRRYHGWLMNITSAQLLEMIDELKYGQPLKDITVPCLLVHGADDQIALPAGSDLAAQLLGTEKHKVVSYVYPNVKHEFFTEVEPESSRIVDVVVSYAKQQISSTETVSAADVTTIQNGKNANASTEKVGRKLVPAQ